MSAIEESAAIAARTADVGLAEWFTARARTSPERPALSFEGRTQTFGEMDDRVRRLAAALRAGGTARGDRVAFLGFNHPHFLEALLATAALGAVYVPLNFRCTGPELAFMIDHAGVQTLIVDSEHREVIEGIRSDVPSVERCVATDFEGWEALEDLVAAADPLAAVEPTAQDDPVVIMYTSGTTGRPKGATLSHGNIFFNDVNFIVTVDVAYDDVSLVVAPLFHIGGLNVTTLATWMKGGHVILHRAFDPKAALEALVAERVTTMFAVPAMAQAMAAEDGFDDADLSCLRALVCGGAPVPEGLIRLYQARGVDLAQGYGLTEAAPLTCFLTPEYALSKCGSAGRPPLLCEMSVVDADGNHITEPGVPGELVARGPNIMLGYFNDEEATRAAIDADGWLHTGDGGYRDADGFYFVSDRIKDMIISGGENIYPAEVEGVLFDHPKVAEVAVIGVADEKWGETVCAVVAPAGGEAATLDELQAFARERLAGYKVPRRMELIDALPRNPAGKVLKVELRGRFA